MDITIVSQFFEKSNVYEVIGTRHVVSLRCENSHEIYILKMKFKKCESMDIRHYWVIANPISTQQDHKGA